MIHKEWVGDDLGGSGRGLIWDTISAFAWRNWGRLWKILSPRQDPNPAPAQYKPSALLHSNQWELDAHLTEGIQGE
jgi:phage tail protein X